MTLRSPKIIQDYAVRWSMYDSSTIIHCNYTSILHRLWNTVT